MEQWLLHRIAHQQKSKWGFYIEPYLMIPNMKGVTGIRNLPDVKVDADAGDIFSHLQIGAMLYAEAHNEHFAISSDIIYMHLKQDVSSTTTVNSGRVDMKQFAWELAGLYKVLHWLEFGVGARLNNLEAGYDIYTNAAGGGTVNRVSSKNITWIDPIIITRAKFAASQKLLFQFRGDIGGFGAGSKFAWQIQADVAYRISKLLQLGLGYRVISIDYEKGSGNERFLYDVNTFGPVLRIGFNF